MTRGQLVGQAGCHYLFTEQIPRRSRGCPGSKGRRVEREGCLPQLGRQGEEPPRRAGPLPTAFPAAIPRGEPGRSPRLPSARSRRVLPGCTARCRLDPRLGSPVLPSLISAPQGPSSRLGQPPRLVGFQMTSQRRAGPFPRTRGGDQLPPGASPSS